MPKERFHAIHRSCVPGIPDLGHCPRVDVPHEHILIAPDSAFNPARFRVEYTVRLVHNTVISVRRFCARPSSVSLEAHGLVSPNPAEVTRVASMP